MDKHTLDEKGSTETDTIRVYFVISPNPTSDHLVNNIQCRLSDTLFKAIVLAIDKDSKVEGRLTLGTVRFGFVDGPNLPEEKMEEIEHRELENTDLEHFLSRNPNKKFPYPCLTFDYKTADVVTRSAPNHKTIINDLEFDLNVKVFYKIIVMKLKSFKFDVAIQGLATPTMNLTPGLTCPCGVESDSKFFKSFSLKSGESENIEYPLGVSNLTFEFNRDIGWLTGFFQDKLYRRDTVREGGDDYSIATGEGSGASEGFQKYLVQCCCLQCTCVRCC